MSEREDRQGQQQLSQLRQEVKLSSSKLLDLTYNENQYVDTLEQYNQQAKTLIQAQQYQQAILYLAQAEKLLQYGASCGKTIDRALIILTLHNQACCYYKASDLSTASRYIQGIIFNLKNHLQSVDTSPTNSSSSEHPRGSKSQQMTTLALEKKMELIHYHLKYCTINSQAKNRKVALGAGKKTIQILKSLLPELKQPKALLIDNSTEKDDIQQLLKGIRVFKEQVKTGELNNYMKLTRFYVKKWNQDKVVKKVSYSLEKHISNYSISQVIELIPLEYQPQNNDNVPNSRSAMRQIIHFSMAYFTISTQYRLIADQLYKKVQEKQISEQYIKANIYHLLSILFLALYLPCDLLFMKQVISSYEHHFKTNIMEQTKIDQAETLLQALVIQQNGMVKSNLMNAALVAKLQKLRSKSKQRKVVHTQYEDTEIYQSKACYKTNQTKLKNKRSTSKQKVLNKLKKPLKVLDDSLFESSKNVHNISKQNKPRAISKQRSTSNAKDAIARQITKARSNSKEVPSNSLKLPVKVVEMAAIDKPRKNKNYHDQYQLGNSKQNQVKKRSRSISSSADLSCTAREINRTKNGQRVKKSQKKKLEGHSKQKKLKESNKGKQVYSKHYYV